MDDICLPLRMQSRYSSKTANTDKSGPSTQYCVFLEVLDEHYNIICLHNMKCCLVFIERNSYLYGWFEITFTSRLVYRGDINSYFYLSFVSLSPTDLALTLFMPS